MLQIHDEYLNHGNAVWAYLERIISGDWDGMRIPDWLKDNHVVLVSYLPDIKVLRDYVIYHDCGKHLVKEIDKDGRVHYPNHASVSSAYYLSSCSGTAEKTHGVYSSNSDDFTTVPIHASGESDQRHVGDLIAGDMFFHTCSSKELEVSRVPVDQLATLLITALAELHANAELFGGIDSTSFKIKYKRIKQRGNQFCREHLAEEPQGHGHCYVFVRGDLPDSQKAIQGGHAAVEAERKFKNKSHPSLVYLKVKSENKLKSVIKELISYDVNFAIFRDNIFDNQITAVATEPLYGDKRALLKRYTLL